MDSGGRFLLVGVDGASFASVVGRDVLDSVAVLGDSVVPASFRCFSSSLILACNSAIFSASGLLIVL